jgi:hypothetical protein
MGSSPSSSAQRQLAYCNQQVRTQQQQIFLYQTQLYQRQQDQLKTRESMKLAIQTLQLWQQYAQSQKQKINQIADGLDAIDATGIVDVKIRQQASKLRDLAPNRA